VQNSNFHFAYINSTRNYIINCVDLFFSDTQGILVQMFANKQLFLIHDADQNCSQESGSLSENNNANVSEFILATFPKQKYLMIVAKILDKHSLVNDDLFFSKFNDIHLADFISFINNRFDKKKENPRLTKLCKSLQAENIRFPNVSIKNVRAKKCLC